MLNMKDLQLNIPKISFLLVGWGLLIILGGIINQWFNLSADFILWLWAGVTILGIAAQVIGLVKGMELNLTIWIILIVIGWAFTFYVTKFDNGAHIDLFGDLTGVWLLLLGLGYIATAFQVDKRWLIVAGLHLAVGALVELSSRRVISIEFVDTFSALVFGLVGGLPLIVAAFPVWFEKEQQPQPTPQYTPQRYY